MSRKNLLDYKYIPAFKIIGIVSHLKGYRLAWNINQHIGADLKMMPDFNWKPAESDTSSLFTLYNYNDPESFMQIMLINNRTEIGSVISKPRNIDYLLLLRGNTDTVGHEELVKNIRRISQVQMAIPIETPPDKITTEMLYNLEMFLELNS